MTKSTFLALALAASGIFSAAQAATAWNESVSGDLSNVGTAPTGVNLVAGSNLVLGATGRNTSGVVDRDYFTFTLPTGFQLNALNLLPGSTFLGPESISFIAIQSGPQVTVNPTGGSAAGLLGWWLYSANDIDTDILQLMASSPGAVGYVGALPAGTYSVWVQETGTGVANYNFDFQVTAVPEPATAASLLAGLAALGWLARRR